MIQDAERGYIDDVIMPQVKQMGVATDIVGIIEQNAASGRATLIPRAEWLRLGTVTGPAP